MIKAIAFDLDDTLLDTTGLLVPAASRLAFAQMQALQMKCSFEDFDQERNRLSKFHSHREIFLKLGQKWSDCSTDLINEKSQRAIEAFYNPIIPDHLPMMPGAQENLEKLKNYHLYLVTAGSKSTQLKKIKACGLEKYFKKCFLLDGFNGDRKKTAFEEIIRAEKIQPHELLSFGNRLGQEIRDGKICGATTCYFEYGEHVGEKPEQAEDHPDFTIHTHQEFIAKCRL